MNDSIKNNLEHLFNQNYNLIKNSSAVQMLDKLIKENPEAFDINLNIMGRLYDKHAIKAFKKAKKNKALNVAFEYAKNMELDERSLIAEFSKDIDNSFSLIREKVNSENKGYTNQIIFLEHDYAPHAYFCGFGKGEYPILSEPGYFEFNFKEELYAGTGKIDYSKIWEPFIKLNSVLEDLGIDDHIFDTEIYQGMVHSYQFKTYLLLHEAFKNLTPVLFEGIPIEKPLFIYGNEHDCEAINIYTFE